MINGKVPSMGPASFMMEDHPYSNNTVNIIGGNSVVTYPTQRQQ